MTNDRMTAVEAIDELGDTLSDWSSFLEGFDPEDRSDGGDPAEDRLEKYDDAVAMATLERLVATVSAFLEANDRMTRGIDAGGAFLELVPELARLVGFEPAA